MQCDFSFRLCALLLAFGFSSIAVKAQNIINVPANQPTIQAAINAASDGDTIVVAPGTYIENIRFLGKAITVTSSGGASRTVIDGGQNGTIVNFLGTETRESVINGFTMTDNAVPLPTPSAVQAYGILVGGASPTITNNIITKNRGFGISITQGGPLIQGNTISYTATAGDPTQDYGCKDDDGSAIVISQQASQRAEILNNTIEFNKAQCMGGAIQVGYGATPLIQNNLISNNISLGFGGAISLANGNQLSIIQNLFYGNNSGAAGGAIYLSVMSDGTYHDTGPVNLFIVNNTFVGNTITFNPRIINAYRDGSQIAFAGYVGQTGIYNNIIDANDSYAAIACDPSYSYLSGTPPLTDHNDILNFSGPKFGGWCPDQTGNSGNISADPRFVNRSSSNFQLAPGSPAIDTGDNSAPNLPDHDIAFQPRIQDATGLIYPLIDMGAYEAAGPANLQATTPDFSMTSSTSSLTINAGKTGTATLTIMPVDGYAGTISFGCNPISTESVCTFNPASLSPTGDNSTLTTTISVNTSVSASNLGDHLDSPQEFHASAPVMGLCLICFVAALVGSSKLGGKWRQQFLLILLCTWCVLPNVSCGGSGSTSPPTTTITTTYMVTAYGTANGILTTHSVNITVTVNGVLE